MSMFLARFCYSLLVIGAVSMDALEPENVPCLSRFDYEFKMMQKIVNLENRFEDLERELNDNLEIGTRKDIQACQDGWLSYKESCYLFTTGDVTFRTAASYCRQHDSHLVYIESQEEDAFLYTFMRDHFNADRHYWIGATDEIVEGSWKWYGSGDEVFHFNWPRGEPNGIVEKIVSRLVHEHPTGTMSPAKTKVCLFASAVKLRRTDVPNVHICWKKGSEGLPVCTWLTVKNCSHVQS